MIFVCAIRVIVLICLGVIVAKRQNIYIDSKLGNIRIEKAIPQFMKRFGMAMDQATAVAIRLESVGRLEIDGSPVDKPSDVPRGQPIAPSYISGIGAAMSTDRTPKTTEYRETSDGFVVSSAFDALVRMKKKKTPPKQVKRK